MFPSLRVLPLLLAAFALALLPWAADAQNRGRDRAQAERQAERQAASERQHGRQAEQRALSDSVRRVGRATQGQVLSAERVRFEGRDVSRVKVIDGNGRVRVLWDDPQSASGDEPRSRTRRDDGDDPTL
jgi:hypothetical protein